MISCFLPDLITRLESMGEKNTAINNDHKTDGVKNIPGDWPGKEIHVLQLCELLPPGRTAGPGRQKGSVCNLSQSAGSQSSRDTEPAETFCCWSSSSLTSAGKPKAAGGRQENSFKGEISLQVQ